MTLIAQKVMLMDRRGFGFPFRFDGVGRVATHTGDPNIQAKIFQVLLTAPGERVQLPEFGCGLRDLVFDPNNEILAATTEYAVGRALARWLGDEILVQSVTAESSGDRLEVRVTYIRRDSLQRNQVKIAF
jgi:phage baseplate assembly protein W